jgi:hypothetical protein
VKAPLDDKPPLIACNDRDRKRMETWLNAKLDRILDILKRELAEWSHRLAKEIKDDPDFQQRQISDGVVEAARRGDLGPARKKYPELAAADMLKLPARPGRGKRFPRPKGVIDDHLLTEAVWVAAKIRVLWKRHYPRRPRGYDSPEAIAARRYGVDEERVRAWAKDRRCMKPPPMLLDIN